MWGLPWHQRAELAAVCQLCSQSGLSGSGLRGAPHGCCGCLGAQCPVLLTLNPYVLEKPLSGMFLAIVTELKRYPGGLTLAIKGSSLEVMHVNSTGQI